MHSITREYLTSIYSHGIIVAQEPIISQISPTFGSAALKPSNEFRTTPAIIIDGIFFYSFNNLQHMLQNNGNQIVH